MNVSYPRKEKSDGSLALYAKTGTIFLSGLSGKFFMSPAGHALPSLDVRGVRNGSGSVLAPGKKGVDGAYGAFPSSP